MEFREVARRRRMTRRFLPDPVEPSVLERLLEIALRAPTAGFAQGVDLLVLTNEEDRARFWAHASDEAWRERSAQSEALMAAPVVIVPLASPEAYVARYAAPDKSASRLAGAPAQSWRVPFWTVDTAFAVMQLLLGATDAGLGALFFDLHGDPQALLTAFGVPPGWLTIGAVLVGHAGADDPPTSPARRPRRALEAAVHRGGF